MKFFTVAALAFMPCAIVMAQQGPESTPLKIGDVAPNFTLTSTMGGKVTLTEVLGKNPVVLAFFPAAFTGG